MNSRKRKLTSGMALALTIALLAGVATVFSAGETILSFFELGPGSSADEGGLTNIFGGGGPGPDWADIFDANGAVVNNFGGTAAFVKDQVSAGSLNDSTAYPKGGSDKNSDKISGWTWTSASVPAKDDITNAYIFATTGTGDLAGHLIIYAGVEREDPSGDSHLDIEFFQNGIGLSQSPPCTSKRPCTFTGSNKNGDLLVNMDFSTGGAFAGLSVRKRDEGANRDNYTLLEDLKAQGCSGDGLACAFSNGGPISGGPWPNFDNHGAVISTLQTNAFTEFGIDVTALLGFTPCFSSVEVKTRSSGSFTAELKDFSLHAFQQCSASASTKIHTGFSGGGSVADDFTTPGHAASPDDIQGTTQPVLTRVHDKAIVPGSIGFATPTGTVTFKRFATADCTGSSTNQTVNLTEVEAPTSTTAGVAAAESSSFVPGAGDLSYQATYNGDANYQDPVTTACEPLTISQFTSVVTTDIKKDDTNGDSVLNKAVDASGAGTTVVDVVTVTGNSGGPDPTGTVTIQRFANGNCSGSVLEETANLQTDTEADGIATAVSAPRTLNTATGSFLSFLVIYNGDTNYKKSAESKCEPLCAFPFVPK